MKVLFLVVFILIAFSCANNEKKSRITTTAKISEKDPNTSVSKNISPDEFRKLSQNNNNILLDVRTSNEYKTGHIKNSISIDWFGDDFVAKVQKLDKDANILLYCKVGGRSARAMQRLNQLGFSKVYNLNGGILAWNSKGFPVTKE